ncbi:hypothetical protein TYRP_008641 [Tyrophagus putrescentiae]|nr:hypothetical protein TYRP_008641 [Tyrophagus putrescentiae]
MSDNREDNDGQMASKNDDGSGGSSASPPGEGGSGSGGGGGGGFMDRFHVRDYASTAEKKANELNSQFGSLCNKVTGTGEKSGTEEKKADGEEGLVDQITEFGTKGYGLMGSLGKKFGGAEK